MANQTPIIPISFVSLLETICSQMELPEPMYQCVDVVKNIYFVTIPYAPPNSYSLGGDESPNEAAGCKSAARKMVLHLVQSRNIMVVDANHDARVEAEQAAQHYGIKCSSFERTEKGQLPLPKCELVPIEGIDYGKVAVQIDFLALFRKIVERFQIGVTPISVNELSDGTFQSWFSIVIAGTIAGKKYIVGDRCPSIAMAKQSLAKKATSFMMYLHRFEVEDVNYHFLKVGTLVANLERESFLTVRERVHGLAEEKEPQPLVIERDQASPRGEANRIVLTSTPPLPPKKRCSGTRPRSFSDVVPRPAIPPELLCIKRRCTCN